MSDRDSLYLFLCHMEWRNRRNLAAYNELVAALDDSEPAIRELAQDLIHRQSPRPTRSDAVVTGHPENDKEAAMAGDRPSTIKSDPGMCCSLPTTICTSRI